jgi:hypothetical protein
MVALAVAVVEQRLRPRRQVPLAARVALAAAVAAAAAWA